MNLDIYPAGKSNKEKCLHQWLWMQEHCINLNILDAKVKYNLTFKENKSVDCWACNEATSRSMHETCSSCPVTWFDDYSDIEWGFCTDGKSPYKKLHCKEEYLTIENAQDVINIIKNTWEE